MVKEMVEARNPGVLVGLVPDGPSSWSPQFQVILIAEHLTPVERICDLQVMLAHRALGHWGRAEWQNVEARELAVRWLVKPQHLRAVAAVADSAAAAAEHLGVTEAVVELATTLYSPAPAHCLTGRPSRQAPERPPGGDVMTSPIDFRTLAETATEYVTAAMDPAQDLNDFSRTSALMAAQVYATLATAAAAASPRLVGGAA